VSRSSTRKSPSGIVKRDTGQPSIEEVVLAALGPGRVAAVSGCPF